MIRRTHTHTYTHTYTHTRTYTHTLTHTLTRTHILHRGTGLDGGLPPNIIRPLTSLDGGLLPPHGGLMPPPHHSSSTSLDGGLMPPPQTKLPKARLVGDALNAQGNADALNPLGKAFPRVVRAGRHLVGAVGAAGMKLLGPCLFPTLHARAACMSLSYSRCMLGPCLSRTLHARAACVSLSRCMCLSYSRCMLGVHRATQLMHTATPFIPRAFF